MVCIVDDRLVESWVKNDVMGLIKQLGANALRLKPKRTEKKPGMDGLSSNRE
jgi:hypothetical protein